MSLDLKQEMAWWLDATLENCCPFALWSAFDQLKPLAVTQAEREGIPIARYGPWFFVPEPTLDLPPEWEISKEAMLDTRPGWREYRAEESARLWVQRARYAYSALYVRGWIAHRGRGVVELGDWHRVYRHDG